MTIRRPRRQPPRATGRNTRRAGLLSRRSGGTKLPLREWMLPLYLLTSSNTNVAALELMRHLGVNCESAWRLEHKVMRAMAERGETRQLKGLVQIDDGYPGGERKGGKPGRGSENEQALLIAVETGETPDHPRLAVIEPVKTLDNATMVDWIGRRLAPETDVYSDGVSCFRRLEDAGHAHTVHDTGGGRAAPEVSCARWVNVVLGNLEPAMSGSYHTIKQAKYARRCLAEAAFRFNSRFRPSDMLPRLAIAMLRCKPCAEPTLRMATNFHG